MKHTVLKLGGSVLRGLRDAAAILDIIDAFEEPLIAVVSALKGVTDRLEAAAERGGGPTSSAALLLSLREEHRALAEALGAPAAALEAATLKLDRILRRLSTLLVSSDPACRAEILATGERLSATCVALAFAALSRPAPIVEPRELGLLASESPDGPSVDLAVAGPSIRAALGNLRDAVVPGFYGVDAGGRPVLFGRGGSDYSAAVVAAGLGAARCDLVKDVEGYFTADPLIVPGARPVSELSYDEAEALARGGAKILHYLTVGPLRAAGIPLRIIGREASSGETRIGPRRAAPEGARAIAIAAGPAGTARLTVACCGWAAKSAALVIGALETRGVAARALSMGPEGASFSIIVDGSRGKEGLRIAHAALWTPLAL
jgi:bifunctional aspartokinase / homoserine dehydrogenase 1